MARRTWSISELAREFDVTLRTIRFYEDRQMVSPARDGQRRIYSERDRVRLQLILRGRRLGFSLDEISRIIDMYDSPPGEDGQLRYLLAEIDHRRQDLLRRREDIEQTLAELDDLERRCRSALDRLLDPAGPRRAAPGRTTHADPDQ
ncbi:MerR family DNA-binding transcriptional regulator [Naumannella halotolerans]|uniref:MerR family transcriptional regulator n=1 Tax=Naumannella halotolerans TaxID=993414 RepID=UPI00370D488A